MVAEEATGEERGEGGWKHEESWGWMAGGRERERIGGGAGSTIGCKSLDKRPRIVKTRRDRDSILISYLVSSRYRETIKGQKLGGLCNSNTVTRGIFRERDANSAARFHGPPWRNLPIWNFSGERDSTKCCCYGLLRFTLEMRYTSRGVGLLNLVILPIGYQLPCLGRDSRA